MKTNLELIKNKKKIISFSTVLILLSLLGILYSTFNTSYKKPINLGMDFVGGNEIRIERVCEVECSNFSPDSVLDNLRDISKNNKVFNISFPWSRKLNFAFYAEDFSIKSLINDNFNDIPVSYTHLTLPTTVRV